MSLQLDQVKRALVLGAGISGRSAAAALRTRGIVADIFDEQGKGEYAQIDEINSPKDYDLVVASPGFSPLGAVLSRVETWNIPIWSELELAWHVRACRPDGTPAPWLLVTGTNGKSTTVGMTAQLLQSVGISARAIGNIGVAASQSVQDPEVDVFVVEVSSFQLHYSWSIAPWASVCLNLATDHVDWHGSQAAYWDSKAKIYERVQSICVYPVADENIRQMVENADVAEGARAVGYGLGIPALASLGIVHEDIIDRAFNADRRTTGRVIATFADFSHMNAGLKPAAHLVLNFMAASALALSLGVQAADLASGLRAFTLAAHRFQHVAQIDGVNFINDSKATNEHAASVSLSAVGESKVVWLMGGDAKGACLRNLVAKHADQLRAVVVLGKDAPKMADMVRATIDPTPVVVVPDLDPGDLMRHAVQTAREFAETGDTVLLAPACASWDQFSSFEERGKWFIHAVNETGE